MRDPDEPVPSPIGDKHPWGGTVIRTGVNQPTYATVVAERFAWDTLDFSNAIAVHILEGFSEAISQSVNWLINHSSESVFITNSKAVSEYFQINTLSSSLFEASSYLLFTEPLCYVESQRGSDIVDLFDEGGEKSWISVRRASDPVEKRIEAVKRIQNNLKPNDYFDLLREYLNVDDALLDEIDELYGERGDIVHGLMGLMKENWFEIKAKTESWGRCVEALIQLLREELSIHDGLYSGLQD